MRRISAWLSLLLCATALLTAIAQSAQTGRLIFLSTQLRPIDEAQKMRNLILKGYRLEVDYVTTAPQQFPVRIKAEEQGGAPTVDVVGALDGELQPLAHLDAFTQLDDFAGRLTGRAIPGSLMTFGRLGTAHQLYIPWMQASYIMVANKEALAYLPDSADINALSYDQLALWADTIRQKTGKPRLGFPVGPLGLMHRFFEGFLYPSYTGGVVVPFRSEAAETMWTQFASLWNSVNPNSTRYDFMQQPLLSGEVWIGWDHVARVRDALRQKPGEFVAFPAPAGPKGRGYMPVLAGLAVPKGAPDMNGAIGLIDYLTRPETQIEIARSVGFLPVVKAELPDTEPGLKLSAGAVDKMQSAKDALPALLPIGLGERAGEFDMVYLDTFKGIVLRGENPSAALDREREALNRLMTETRAPCWAPDPPSSGACQAQ
jgi:multiple sugar transport system substrate-binding protein